MGGQTSLKCTTWTPGESDSTLPDPRGHGEYPACTSSPWEVGSHGDRVGGGVSVGTLRASKPGSRSRQSLSPRRAMASATVVRSSLPMRSSAVSAASASARHVQHSRAGNLTYVTVLSTKTDPEAVRGVLGLHRSLKRVHAAHPLLCLCVNVSSDALGMLQTDGIQVREVAPIAAGHPSAFGKLQVLRLLDYRRVLFLDVDTIVLRNIDHLFELQCDFAFAPDIGFEVSASKMNHVNAGVFVHTPHHGILKDMMVHKETLTSLSAGSHGTEFLQEFINENRDTLDGRMSICDLDIMYNVKRQLFLAHPSLWNCLRREVAVMQFGGRTKPWHVTPTTSQGAKAAIRAPSETSAKGDGGKSGSASASASHASAGKPGVSSPKVRASAAVSGNSEPAGSEHGKSLTGELAPAASRGGPTQAVSGKMSLSASAKVSGHDALQIGSHAAKQEAAHATNATAGPSTPHSVSRQRGGDPDAIDGRKDASKHGGTAPSSAEARGHIFSHRAPPSSPSDKHSSIAEGRPAATRRAPPSPPATLSQLDSHGRPPSACPPPVAPSHGAPRIADEAKSQSGHRGLDSTAKPHEQPKPTSNDPLFGIWWILYEERRLRELPYAKHTNSSTEAEAEAAIEAGGLNCGVRGTVCPSRSESCIHRYLANRSFAISDADLHALPAMIVGLTVAMMWMFLLLYASLCPGRIVRKAKSGVQPSGIRTVSAESRGVHVTEQDSALRAKAPPSTNSSSEAKTNSSLGHEPVTRRPQGSNGTFRGVASTPAANGGNYTRVPA